MIGGPAISEQQLSTASIFIIDDVIPNEFSFNYFRTSVKVRENHSHNTKVGITLKLPLLTFLLVAMFYKLTNLS